jgi:hypothetical protein
MMASTESVLIKTVSTAGFTPLIYWPICGQVEVDERHVEVERRECTAWLSQILVPHQRHYR